MPLDAYCRPPQRGACFNGAADRRPGRDAVTSVAGAATGDRRDAAHGMSWYGDRSRGGSFVGAASGACDAEILAGRHGNEAYAGVFSVVKNDDDPANSPRKGKQYRNNLIYRALEIG
jgi:hypothetical protein